MNKFVKIVLVFTTFVAATSALKCWTCDNAQGVRDCINKGRLRTCQPNEQMCFSETRNINGRWLVTKRCKQPLACKNNEIQNARAASIGGQCNPNRQSSVCRCCCGTDGCNRDGINCEPKKPECRFVPPKPYNGFVKCKFTKSAKEVGSVCTFSCKSGYAVDGAESTTCVVSGGKAIFNKPKPLCRPIQCKPSIKSIENGQVTCDSGTNIGSKCKYSCDFGFDLSGPSTITCGANGEWSDNRLPTCLPTPVCPQQTGPLNGKISCNQDLLSAGTKCSFLCDSGFKLNGVESYTCIEEGDGVNWNDSPPVCEPLSCEVQSPILHGDMVCSDGADVSSVCSFRCEVDSDRELFPTNITTNQCVMNEDGTPSWFPSPPCCGLPCPPNAMMDLVVILDSSSSIEEEEWPVMKKFVKEFIKQFNIGDKSARISVFRYNSVIDEETEIKLKDSADMSMHQLLEKVDRFPLNGQGTGTGLALKHAQEKSLSVEYGNREDVQDVILVITDGQAQDRKDQMRVAKELRKSGVLIFAAGLELNENIYKQMLKMTDSEERTFNVEHFDNLLTGSLIKDLASRVGSCPANPCDN